MQVSCHGKLKEVHLSRPIVGKADLGLNVKGGLCYFRGLATAFMLPFALSLRPTLSPNRYLVPPHSSKSPRLLVLPHLPSNASFLPCTLTNDRLQGYGPTP